MSLVSVIWYMNVFTANEIRIVYILKQQKYNIKQLQNRVVDVITNVISSM